MWKRLNDWYNKTVPEDFTLNLLGTIFWAIVFGIVIGMIAIWG